MEHKMIVNVLGILICYSLLLAMPDDFAMPKDGEDHH
jgi:hypothetical protein